MQQTALLALALLLAGCAAPSQPTPQTDQDTGTGDPADPATLGPDATAPAPAWRVGDWWGLHVYFGSDDTNGLHYTTLVTATGTDTHHLATDSPQAAKEHAVLDYPILGAIRARDLAMTGFGGPWNILAFPLADGATWQGEIPNIAFDILPAGPVPLDFTATYHDALPTPDGTAPGYTVHGRTGEHLVVEYDYVPAAAWFTRFVVYDIDPDQDPLEFTVRLMDHGRGWTGTYYVDTATDLVANLDENGLDDAPPEGEPVARVSPHASFTVPADATYLYGFVEWGAVAGARTLVLFPPDGEPRHWEVAAPLPTGDFQGRRIDEPAQPGTWQVATTGAGGYTYSYLYLAAVHETTGTLP